MSDRTPLDRERTALAHILAGLKTEVALIRLGLALRYDPNQPRQPAGQRDGGQWSGRPSLGATWASLPPAGAATSWTRRPGADGGTLRTTTATDETGTTITSTINEGDRSLPWDERHVVLAPDGTRTVFETSGLTQTIRDGETDEILSRSTWGPNGPELEALRQDARSFRPGSIGLATRNTALPAFSAYEALARDSASKRILTLGINASEYRPEGEPTRATWVGYVGRDDVEQACPRFGLVQEITDAATAKVKRDDVYLSPSDFGTKVHMEIRNRVNDIGDKDFQPEISISKSISESGSYGRTASVRVDVLENVRNGTVCVYDVKTGAKNFSGPRMLELANAVQSRYPGTRRMLLIEIKPTP